MNYQIVSLPGDGIGAEVAKALKPVLTVIGDYFNHQFEVIEQLIGGAAIDACGEPLPQATLDACRAADAVFLGAIGGPKWDSGRVRPEQGLLKLRSELDVFANIRPLTIYPSLASASPLKPEILKGTDFIIVRELTGGIYFGDKKRHLESTAEEYATDECRYSVDEVARIARVAFKLAKQRGQHLTSVDKANVLETSKLWRQVVSKIGAEEFPEIELHHQLVDSCAMKLIQSPAQFDVVLTENMFGDILSDEASVLSGSMGLLASSSVGRRYGLFEPIHGSAPDIAGQGIANPYATILSIAMMLKWLNLSAEGECVEGAIASVIEQGFLPKDLDPNSELSTNQAIQAVVAAITKEKE